MKKIMIITALIILIIGCEKTDEPIPSAQSDMSVQIIQLVNEHRDAQGLSLLAENDLCSTVAAEHSSNMASGVTDFGHDGFDERNDQISASLDIRRIGENVAFGQTSAEQVMNSWINSDGHRANIEGDFTHIGVGIAEDSDGRLYFTQIFIKL